MSPNIIGYIHICQKGDWQKSFRMLIDSIKKSGLYHNSSTIRLGIVNDVGALIPDVILSEYKFDIVHVGTSSDYERPTLLHMKKMAEEYDENNTLYYYLHTKGISHFTTPKELNVIDWINLMLYWNIEQWRLAVKTLHRTEEHQYDTYGCNDVGYHYSGNFWWATRDHIKKLPRTIAEYYTAPEDWIQIVRTNKFCVYNSGLNGMHYHLRYPRELYVDIIRRNEPIK